MLSVIIATSPARQADLACCLQALTRQSFQDFEVIVSDDGSEGMQSVIEAYQERFSRLEYLWRPADRNLSRTRNRGALAALGQGLVFLNTDILLNPEALAAYAQLIHSQPLATIWGYVGCRKRVKAPSLWVQERQINWLDFRFFPLSETQLWIHPQFQQQPYRFASGHHFALSRQAWQEIGPLDESFIDWGEEDVEFALRGLLKGCSMFLLGDAWAEHLAHPYQEAFHLDSPARLAQKQARITELEQALLTQGLADNVRIGVLFGPQLPLLYKLIQTHYLPFEPQALQAEMQPRLSW